MHNSFYSFWFWPIWGFWLLQLGKAHLPDPPVFDAISHYPSICYLPPDSGLCPIQTTPPSIPTNYLDSSQQQQQWDSSANASHGKSGILRTNYYFDLTTEQCYPFGVQSCGGNANRFETLADCQNTCRIQN